MSQERRPNKHPIMPKMRKNMETVGEQLTKLGGFLHGKFNIDEKKPPSS